MSTLSRETTQLVSFCLCPSWYSSLKGEILLPLNKFFPFRTTYHSESLHHPGSKQEVKVVLIGVKCWDKIMVYTYTLKTPTSTLSAVQFCLPTKSTCITYIKNRAVSKLSTAIKNQCKKTWTYIHNVSTAINYGETITIKNIFTTADYIG